jgi:hypothetical protein
MQDEAAPKDGALYESVKAMPSKRLANGVEKVDGLSPEEEEMLERGGNLALRGTKRRVLRWSWYTGFGFGALLLLALCIAIIAMGAIYIYQLTESGKLGDAIGALLQFLFGAAVTLAAEFLIKKASGKA